MSFFAKKRKNKMTFNTKKTKGLFPSRKKRETNVIVIRPMRTVESKGANISDKSIQMSNFLVRISIVFFLVFLLYLAFLLIGIEFDLVLRKLNSILLCRSFNFLFSRLGWEGGLLLAAIFVLLEQEEGETESGKTMMAPSGSSGSEPSVNQGPKSNGADAGPSGAPSSSSFEEDSFELRVLVSKNLWHRHIQRGHACESAGLVRAFTSR